MTNMDEDLLRSINRLADEEHDDAHHPNHH